LQIVFVSLIIMTMLRGIILFFCLIPFWGHAQKDVLILQKNGMHVRAYAVGDELNFKTVYGQWLGGNIEDMYHDSIYIIGQVFHYKEIAAIRFTGRKNGNNYLGTMAIIAGGGFLAIGAVNGMLRKDASKDWYTTSGLVIGGALIGGGFLLTKFRSKDYNLGGRFKLQYLQISKERYR
jgi:hypothetical protein